MPHCPEMQDVRELSKWLEDSWGVENATGLVGLPMELSSFTKKHFRNIAKDYRLNWRDTVRKGDYKNGASWLNSLGEDEKRMFLEFGRMMNRHAYTRKSSSMADGSFQSPLKLIHGKLSEVGNFPEGVSPRLIQIIDYITSNPGKWETGWMRNFTLGYPNDFQTNYEPFVNRTDDKSCGLWEVFRVVTTDNDNAYCVKQLYSMGVGMRMILDKETQHHLNVRIANVTEGTSLTWNAEVDEFYHKNNVSPDQPNFIAQSVNTKMIETETLGLKSNCFVLPNGTFDRGQSIGFDSKLGFRELEKIMHESFPLESHYQNHLQEGTELFAIPLDSIVMRTKDMAPIAVMKQRVAFGDYVCLLGDITENRTSIRPGELSQNKWKNNLELFGVKTRKRTDSVITDVIISPDRMAGFIHLSQMDAAFGSTRKHNLHEKDNLHLHHSQEALDKIKVKDKFPDKTMRVMEYMSEMEMVNMMTGIATAEGAGMDIGQETDDIGNPESRIKINFIPTWKDNRKTIEINKGSAFSDSIRCIACNQKYKIKLPANNKKTSLECQICSTTDGLKVGHLVEGNPGVEIPRFRPYR